MRADEIWKVHHWAAFTWHWGIDKDIISYVCVCVAVVCVCVGGWGESVILHWQQGKRLPIFSELPLGMVRGFVPITCQSERHRPAATAVAVVLTIRP